MSASTTADGKCGGPEVETWGRRGYPVCGAAARVRGGRHRCSAPRYLQTAEGKSNGEKEKERERRGRERRRKKRRKDDMRASQVTGSHNFLCVND